MNGIFSFVRIAEYFFSKLEEFPEGTDDDGDVCSGGLPCEAGIMTDGPLGDRIAFAGGACEDFGVDECSGAFHLDVVKDFTFIELEGAVDVFEFHFEEHIYEFAPPEGIEFSEDTFSAFLSIATYDVILFDEINEGREFGDIELTVAVGIKHEVLLCGSESGLESGAIAAITFVMDRLNSCYLLGEGICDFARTVRAAVVDDDDLVVICQPLKDGDCPGDETLNGCSFVVAGEKDAYRRASVFIVGGVI